MNVTESRKLEFTEGWIRRLDPAPQGKRVAYSDMVVQGLRLRVNDQGEKIFSVVYRLRGDNNGAPKTFTIGRYPDEYKIKGARDEALRVLPELKAGRDQGKLILRRILADYLPREIWNRPKIGFSAPLESWLRGALRPWAEELLEPARLQATGFRPAPVRKKWLEHVSGTQNWQYALWPVLMWQAFFDEAGRERCDQADLRGVNSEIDRSESAPRSFQGDSR